MRSEDVLKTVGIVVKGVLKVVGAITITGIALAKAYEERYHTNYNDAVRAIMNSSMWSTDKAKAISVLDSNAKPEFYLSIIRVVESSMWSSDKLNVILEMCEKAEEPK